MIPQLSDAENRTLKQVAIVYAIWVAASIASWFYLPGEWQWLTYLPLAFPVFAVGITVMSIILRPILPKPIPFVYIGRQRVTCCQFCPMVDTKENPVNGKFPILKCRETAKVCYNPMQIPGWCPYAD